MTSETIQFPNSEAYFEKLFGLRRQAVENKHQYNNFYMPESNEHRDARMARIETELADQGARLDEMRDNYHAGVLEMLVSIDATLRRIEKKLPPL